MLRQPPPTPPPPDLGEETFASGTGDTVTSAFIQLAFVDYDQLWSLPNIVRTACGVGAFGAGADVSIIPFAGITKKRVAM